MTSSHPALLVATVMVSGGLLIPLLARAGHFLHWMMSLSAWYRSAGSLLNSGRFALKLPLVSALALASSQWSLSAIMVLLLLMGRILLGSIEGAEVTNGGQWRRECALPSQGNRLEVARLSMLFARNNALPSPGIWSPWVAIVVALSFPPGTPEPLRMAAFSAALYSLATLAPELLPSRLHRWSRPLLFAMSLALGPLIYAHLGDGAAPARCCAAATLASLGLQTWIETRGRTKPTPLGRVFDPARISYGQFVQQMGFSGLEGRRTSVRFLIHLRTLSALLTASRSDSLAWRADLALATIITFFRVT